ncbi:MAG: hypothetical protein J2P22_03315 [Nocardioides sp.]|nr:hypothetical protein [Nocardioides sp.]
MRPIHRWAVVAGVFVLLALAPMAGRAIPAHDRSLSAGQLLSLVRDGYTAPYSGTVEASGRLGLPFNDRFTDLADLLGGQTRLRVWWRGPDDWRVDRLLDTGEVDLFHHQDVTTQWDYERDEASVGPDPEIRLPRDSDLLPPRLAALLLAGADGSDGSSGSQDESQVSRLGARRIAGRDGLGLRLRVDDPRSSIDHVDLWADASTGTVLAIDVYGAGSVPVLTSAFTSFDSARPTFDVTRFRAPAGVRQHFEPLLDFADAANQYAPLTPPETLAGLARSNRKGRGVGAYGTGPTRLVAIPLQQRDAAVLTDQLYNSGATMRHGQSLLRAGPLGIMLTAIHSPFEFQWLLTGTVTDDTLRRAAAGLARGSSYR